MYFWSYLWTEQAGWKRLRQNAPLEHLRGEIPLQPCDDGFVRIATVSGHTNSREPLDVVSLDFTKHAADARGVMTEAQQHEHMALAMRGLDPFRLGPPSSRGPTVIDATALFERRRHDAAARWRPSREALEDFCRLVNERARRSLLALR